MTVDEMVEKEGVELHTYLSWIKSELDDENACLELPFTIILLISFSCLAIMHLAQHRVFSLEETIEFDIKENANFAWSHAFGHKGIFDVNSIADFWSWLRLGFFPLVFQQSWAYSESLQASMDDMLAAPRRLSYPSRRSQYPFRDKLQHNTNYNELLRKRWPSSHQRRLDHPPYNRTGPYDTDVLKSRWQIAATGGNAEKVPIRGDYLWHNRLVGGIKITQEVSERDFSHCRMPPTTSDEVWREWLGKPCFGIEEVYQYSPETMTIVDMRGKPGRTEWFLTDLENIEDMIEHTVDMEDGCHQVKEKGRDCLCEWCAARAEIDGGSHPWVDETTQRVDIRFASFNPTFGLLSMTSTNFFFNRGGAILKFVDVQSVWVDQWNWPISEVIPMAICDAIWLLSLLYIFVSESREMIGVVWASKQRFYKSLWEDYIGFWNVVDWVSVVSALLICLSYILFYTKTGEVNEALLELTQFRKAALAGSLSKSEYSTKVKNFYDQLEEMAASERFFRQLMCVYPMIVMLRLFKSFAAQPRLAVVTDTLSQSAQDMLHFFIIFFSVYICFAVNAVLLFGQDLEVFSTVDRSIHACFLMMFGDWDFDSLAQVGRIRAGIWFWLFVLVILVVLYNMLMAILMDAYGLVKQQAGDAQTLPGQMKEMNRRRKQTKAKQRVRLNDVWDAFSKLYGDEKEMLSPDTEVGSRKITPAWLTEHVQDMKHTQAHRTLKNSWKKANKEKPFDLKEDAKKVFVQIDNLTRDIRDAYTKAKHRIEFYDTMPPPRHYNGAHQVKPVSVHTDDHPEDADQNASTEGIVEHVNISVGQLSSEMANVLAHQMKLMEKRQNHVENRQSEMFSTIKDMNHTLQQLQATATETAHTMERRVYKQKHELGIENGENGAGGFLNLIKANGTSNGHSDSGSKKKR
eukprot:gnl/MRDRNA2_/MRDRNA2_33937_c0_seq2.p1 gnl/MRDRNA2_/MRDRNA2_33937_c0~~gnl/MRDRNA2_/MRDRNA2_33937_c0_seq2.p1  ORF type:complete len:966 (+),score=177.31 gnl/MRDRNA2_/MRDRNA2_33937_c0_seq2:160-2898(+)